MLLPALLIALVATITAPAVSPPRAVAFAPPPPARIAFLGDSLTLGLHASSPELMYREILRRRIAGRMGTSEAVSVVQDPFGLTDDALRRVQAVIDARPDLVILEIGNHEAFAPADEIARFEQRYDELLRILQDTGAVVIAGTLTWLNYAADSRQYANALRLNETIRRLCARRGIAVADLWTATLFRPDYISRPGEPSATTPFEGDDLHPNDAGHQALADAYWHTFQHDRARRALQELPR